MEAWIAAAAHFAALVIEAMALIVIAAGSVEAFVNGFRGVLSGRARDDHLREVWLRYGRWLVAGLTFQLASDVLHTSIAPSWQDIGQLGAIAAIRTFLSYFLERDMEEMRSRRRAHPGADESA